MNTIRTRKNSKRLMDQTGPSLPSLRGKWLSALVCSVTGTALLLVTQCQSWQGNVLGGLLICQAVCDMVICLSRPGKERCVLAERTPRVEVSHAASPIRESWRFLPNWLQGALTRLSGRPLRGQTAAAFGPRRQLAAVLLELVLSTALTAGAVVHGGAFFLLAIPGLCGTTHCMRFLALTVFHECAHESFTRIPRLDCMIGEILGVLLLGQSFGSYRPEHRADHHGTGFMTNRDPTIAFQRKMLGLVPGMARRESWCRLLISILSPRYHLVQTVGRLRSNWRGASILHRCFLPLYLIGLGVLVGMWPKETLIAWVLPLLLLTNASVGVRACFEHHYALPSLTRTHSPEWFTASTHGIFFGSAAPRLDVSWPRRLVYLSGWMLRMLLYHLPARALFCPGESPAHDYHHRHPRAGLLNDPLFARQQALESARSIQSPYTEIWTVHAAIDEFFHGLEAAGQSSANLPRTECLS